jgi:diguanylate cyclase (GGDEF)-like protein/PAS domain S-box-containing protein
MSWSTPEAPVGFRGRLRARLLDPVNFVVPPVIGVLCLARPSGIIADIPYWEIVVLVISTLLINCLGSALWSEATAGRQLVARVGVEMGTIALVVYGIGWGPILVIGFVYGAADTMRTAGSAAARPAMVWTVIFVALGELAIFTGLAPTLVRQPQVHGLGALAALGAVFTIMLLEWFAVAREGSEGRFRSLVQHASDIIVVTDLEGRLSYVSPAFDRVLGISTRQFGNRQADELLHPDDLARLRATADGLREGWRTEMRLQDTAGTWHWFEATVTDHLEDPNVLGIVANLHDISERKAAEDALREAHERFRSAFENAPIGMAMIDLDGHIIRANPALGAIVGQAPTTLTGTSAHDLIHPEQRDAGAAEMRQLMDTGSEGYRIETRYLHCDEREVWVSVSVSCVCDDENRPLYLIAQVEDVTEHRALRERLAYAAIHDPLTALPNRELFMDRLEMTLRRCGRTQGTVAVMFLDIDRFKLINDSLGHDVGDRILCAVADRLCAVMRESDTLARFGGDEFTVLCADVNDENDALEVAQRLVMAMREPLALPSGETFVSLSVGIALSGNGPESGAELLRNADVAMYRAKERGPARIEIYATDNEQSVVSRLRTSNELHRALERDELELHYQPVVDLQTQTLVGMEALVRWQHPTRGLLLPYEFITLAEDSGLIVPLGAWVLHEACRQTAAWTRLRADAGVNTAGLSISVNVSALQLAEPGFPTLVAEALDLSGLSSDRLWLEITESALMRDADEAVLILQSLRDLGLHVEIDDFGTGYSSLSYLQRFPVETLKIDRSFVDDLDQRSENAAIVRAILGLGDSLGLAVIAEGVERPVQATRLQALGCQLGQGYLFGKPRPARALGAFPCDDLGSWNESFPTPIFPELMGPELIGARRASVELAPSEVSGPELVA